MNEFQAVLAECLDALREGRADVASCLRAHPEHAAELRLHLLAASALMQTFGAAEPSETFQQAARERFLVASGETLQQAFDIAPSEEFREAARERFLVASGARISEAYDIEPSPSFFAATRVKFLMAAHRMRLGKQPAESLRFLRVPVRALAGAGAAAVLFLSFSTYTVASAADAVPGDWNYGVKLQTERVRLAMAFTEDAEQDLRLDIANERVREIEKLSKRGKIIGPGVLDRLAEQTEPLVEAANNGKLDESELARVSDIGLKQKAVLAKAEGQIAPGAEEQLAQARTVAENAVAEAVARIPGPTVIPPSIAFQTPEPDATSTPEASATPDAAATPDSNPTPPPTPTSTPARGPVVDATPVDVRDGVTWVRLAVGYFSTLIPSEKDGWRIVGISAADGSGPTPSLVRLSNADGTSLITLNPRNGDMYWFVAASNGAFDEVQMRATRDGQIYIVDAEVLRRLYGAPADLALFVMTNIEVTPPPPPVPTATATATATVPQIP